MKAILPLLICLAVADQARSADPTVTYLSGSDVAKAIRDAPKGAIGSVPLATASEYRILGVRRSDSGQAELHEKEADVWYVIEGRCSLVTGGELVDSKTTAPGEVRGTSIRGGETRAIGKGDVITIAAGVPHWVQKVEAPMQYLVVKVTQKP